MNNHEATVKTKLITPEGYTKLKNEHDLLWYEQRPEITKIVTWAASLGDRSENADYQYNKRKLLPELQIVNYSPQQAGKVFFGAMVEIENAAGEIKRFRIVGPEEIYGDAKGYISIDSPMARALLKMSVDDIVSVNTPEGFKEWFINTIEYKKS